MPRCEDFVTCYSLHLYYTFFLNKKQQKSNIFFKKSFFIYK